MVLNGYVLNELEKSEARRMMEKLQMEVKKWMEKRNRPSLFRRTERTRRNPIRKEVEVVKKVRLV
jgi:hypothetical protein